MSYQYWIIRFVPNVARGEFTNIGIVCGSDDRGDWAVGFDSRSVRNRGSFSSDLRELSNWTAWFRRTIESHSSQTLDEQSVSSGWIQQLRSRQSNSIQFSEPAPIDVESARDGVELLFPHLVEREPARRARTLTRQSLRGDVRDTLLYESDFTLGQNLFVQPKLQIGKLRGAFDFLSVEDGTDELTNVWAFNVATLEVLEREVQSWNYLVTRFRDAGATLRLGANRTARLDADAPIDVVYDPPSSMNESDWRRDIFDAALEAWDLSGVTSCTMDEFHGVPTLTS